MSHFGFLTWLSVPGATFCEASPFIHTASRKVQLAYQALLPYRVTATKLGKPKQRFHEVKSAGALTNMRLLAAANWQS